MSLPPLGQDPMKPRTGTGLPPLMAPPSAGASRLPTLSRLPPLRSNMSLSSLPPPTGGGFSGVSLKESAQPPIQLPPTTEIAPPPPGQEPPAPAPGPAPAVESEAPPTETALSGPLEEEAPMAPTEEGDAGAMTSSGTSLLTSSTSPAGVRLGTPLTPILRPFSPIKVVRPGAPAVGTTSGPRPAAMTNPPPVLPPPSVQQMPPFGTSSMGSLSTAVVSSSEDFSELTTSTETPVDTMKVEKKDEKKEEDLADLQGYPFFEPDRPTNIQFVTETERSERPVVRCGTLPKLVERLTFAAYPDPDYVNAFLLTYRSFTTPAELFELLSERFRMPQPDHVAVDATDEWVRTQRDPVRLRVFNVIKQWLTSYFSDFEADSSLVMVCRDCIDNMILSGMDKAGEQLKKQLEKKLAGGESQLQVSRREHPPAPILPQNLTSATIRVTELSPLEVARQMSLIEMALYRKIRAWEFLGQAWTKSNKEERAPNILAMIRRFNLVSRWAATSIVAEEDLKQRGVILSFWIDVAMELRSLNNYNAMMEIVSGLGSSSIFRLKKTWALVKKERMKALDEIRELMSRENNFKRFRDHLHNVNPPCVPYLGVYLTDLTFIEDGNKDMIVQQGLDENGVPLKALVNFGKRAKVARVIAEVQQYQQTGYNLDVVAFISDLILEPHFLTEDECYKLSNQRELKENERKGSNSSATAKRSGTISKGSGKSAKDALKASQAIETTPSKESSSSGAAGAEEEPDWGELAVSKDYLFLEKDSKDNIIFDMDESAMMEGMGIKVQIRAASLPKLVERITSPKWPDPSLVSAFLLTYPTFTTAVQLIGLLVQRFQVPLPKAPELQQKYREMVQLPVQLRVYNMLKIWVDRYPQYLKNEAGALDALDNMCQVLASGGMNSASEGLKKTVVRLREGLSATIERRSTEVPPPSIFPPETAAAIPSLRVYNPVEMARQMTAIDSELYKAIEPEELLNCGWKLPDRDRATPCVHAILSHNERMVLWVATEICAASDSDEAGEVVVAWIRVAEALHNINNFNGMRVVIQALALPDIANLRLVWAGVPNKYRQTLAKLQTFNSYSKMMDKCKNTQPPIVYSVDLLLDHISDVQSQAPDQIQNLINVEKRLIIAADILDMKQSHQQTHLFSVIDIMRDFILKSPVYPAAEFVQRSQHLLTKAAARGTPVAAPKKFTPAIAQSTPSPVSTQPLPNNPSPNSTANPRYSLSEPMRVHNSSEPDSASPVSSPFQSLTRNSRQSVDISDSVKLQNLLLQTLRENEDFRNEVRTLLLGDIIADLEKLKSSTPTTN